MATKNWLHDQSPSNLNRTLPKGITWCVAQPKRTPFKVLRSSTNRTPTMLPICFHQGHVAGCFRFGKLEQVPTIQGTEVSCLQIHRFKLRHFVFSNFRTRNWTMAKLNSYCMKHYGVKPDLVFNRLQPTPQCSVLGFGSIQKLQGHWTAICDIARNRSFQMDM